VGEEARGGTGGEGRSFAFDLTRFIDRAILGCSSETAL